MIMRTHRTRVTRVLSTVLLTGALLLMGGAAHAAAPSDLVPGVAGENGLVDNVVGPEGGVRRTVESLTSGDVGGAVEGVAGEDGAVEKLVGPGGVTDGVTEDVGDAVENIADGDAAGAVENVAGEGGVVDDVLGDDGPASDPEEIVDPVIPDEPPREVTPDEPPREPDPDPGVTPPGDLPGPGGGTDPTPGGGSAPGTDDGASSRPAAGSGATDGPPGHAEVQDCVHDTAATASGWAAATGRAAAHPGDTVEVTGVADFDLLDELVSAPAVDGHVSATGPAANPITVAPPGGGDVAYSGLGVAGLALLALLLVAGESGITRAGR
ncbi:hypothetical protein [Georgenia alba]|uniref:Uncharacterized protein n=1 Tax=Georgenia alba TaxID=2233858 RepID=A0ABW2Q4Q3_9MICO